MRDFEGGASMDDSVVTSQRRADSNMAVWVDTWTR